MWQHSRRAQLRRQPHEEEPRKTGARYGGAAGKTYRAMKLRFTAAILSLFATANPSFGGSITLDGVLNSTLEKNPAIQQAKAHLEQAPGRPLALRRAVLP